MGLTEPQRAAYRFLRKRAEDGSSFSPSDLEKLVGWQAGSFSTYKTKHLKEYLSKAPGKRLLVDRRFMRLTEDDFADIVGQSRKTMARFKRAIVHSLLRFEFLLPLTNERRLRAALDELFYREPLEQRAREIGRASLAEIVPPTHSEDDPSYFARVAGLVGALLGGYSIGHVDGRFRAGDLRTYGDAANLLAGRGRYLVDETTAVVRFIIPLPQSRVETGHTFDAAQAADIDAVELRTDVDRARRLFIAFFVESVIFDIHGEDEIWFLESSPEGERLYVLERDSNSVGKTSIPPKPAAKGGTHPGGTQIVQWLRSSSYTEIAAQIENIEAEWKRNNVKTRRNWFEVLGGDRQGRPRSVAGVEFPIIASIRARQGLDPVLHAERRSDEKPLPTR